MDMTLQKFKMIEKLKKENDEVMHEEDNQAVSIESESRPENLAQWNIKVRHGRCHRRCHKRCHRRCHDRCHGRW